VVSINQAVQSASNNSLGISAEKFRDTTKTSTILASLRTNMHLHKSGIEGTV
jgi:hypothetical protein